MAMFLEYITARDFLLPNYHPYSDHPEHHESFKTNVFLMIQKL